MLRLAFLTGLAWSACSTGCTIGHGPTDAGRPDSGDERGIVVVGQITSARFPVRIVDVEVCVLDRPEIGCARTDDFGRYVLTGLPEGEDLVILMDHPRYRSLARLLSTHAGPPPRMIRDGMVALEDWEPIRSDVAAGAADPHFVVVRSYEPELGSEYGSRGLTPTLAGGAVGPTYVGDGLVIDPAAGATAHESGLAFFHGAATAETDLRVTCAEGEAIVEPWNGWPTASTGVVRAFALDDYDVLAAVATCRSGPRCSFSNSDVRPGRALIVRIRNASVEPVEVHWVSPGCVLWPTPEIALEAGEEGDIGARYGWGLRVVNAAGEDLGDFYVTDRSIPDGDTALYVHE